MRVNIKLSRIHQNDTIIVANNRQVLAIKRSISEQHGVTKLPNICSYASWLEKFWQQQNTGHNLRLLSQSELRLLFTKIIESGPVAQPDIVIEELTKCYRLCKSYFIEIESLANYSSTCNLFVGWIRKLEKTKKEKNYIDSTDLYSQIYLSVKKINKTKRYFIYGFKKTTPEQKNLFDALECETINPLSRSNSPESFSFPDSETEIQAIAEWAKELSANKPNHQIGIVVPNISESKFTVNRIFDQVFNSSLLETRNKPYNISLGIPLLQYPLIKHLLNILALSEQIIKNRIDHQLLIHVITSPYITGAQKESNNRSLQVNRILAIKRESSGFKKITNLVGNCEQFVEVMDEIKQLKLQKKLLHEDWLVVFNQILFIWGFTSDRELTSDEFQLLKKFQEESLILNKISDDRNNASFDDAINTLQSHLGSVVFQAQSGAANIHILGALEAEGLSFDSAWISNMTSNFLPGNIKIPLFIPTKVCVEYGLPNSSFEIIRDDTNVTIDALNNLSSSLVYSYAKSNNEKEQLSTPYFSFDEYQLKKIEINTSRELIAIDDSQAPCVEDQKIKEGVATLQDQMSCAFKGFSKRLQIEKFEAPHIGFNRLEQGNLIHNALETFYTEIKSKESLLELLSSELDGLLERHIDSAINNKSPSSFQKLEKIRIKKILHNYFKLEKQRDGYEVIKTESTTEVSINNLSFKIRLDRIDRLPNGNKLIIDYKTGKAEISQMTGKPIKQAQLPIYALTNNVNGVAFAKINATRCEYLAITNDESALPVKKATMPKWEDQLVEWESILNSASYDFQNGVATVLPEKNACEYCDYDLLCRVEKLPNHR